MDQFLTPLLRRVYLLFGVAVGVYLGSQGWQYSSWHKELLYRKLLAGSQSEQASAAFDLAYFNGEPQLLRALKSNSPAVRALAVTSLWEVWARAGGHAAFHQIQLANQAVEQHAFPQALQILTRVTKQYPEFPEGWNRRATLYWEMGRFEDSIADCQRVVALNPNHFGAWQGMGLCEIHLGNFEEAYRCVRRALRISPQDPSLQQFLNRCEELLRLVSPESRVHVDTV